MKYQNLRDDLLAINELLEEGMIDSSEAIEMRNYLLSLSF